MIYLLAYAAVALFCWGWFFQLGRGYAAAHPDDAASYWSIALASWLGSLIWPLWLVVALAVDGRLFWHGWRLPYLERLWRRK